MLSQNQHLVLGMMKQIVPGSVLPFSDIPHINLPALGEFADYIAMVVPQRTIRKSASIYVNHLAYRLFLY
jgi:hypothetical protein